MLIGEARTPMIKMRIRFVLCTTNAYWTTIVGETMAKTMNYQIIQINTRKKLKTNNISNIKNRLFGWMNRLPKNLFKLTISGDRSSIIREKVPVFLAIRKK